MMTLEEYRAEVLALVQPATRFAQVPLGRAAGRVLARPVGARVAIPAFDNSAMDGFAVRARDVTTVPVRLRVVADIAAGSSLDPALGPGECSRIMTGAPVPSAADAIVPVEDTDASFVQADGFAGGAARSGVGSFVQMRVAPRPGVHIRRTGEDLAAGAQVASVGDEVTPALVGLLAAVGVGAVAVRPRPVVAVISTGDELATIADSAGGPNAGPNAGPDAMPLGRGRIFESNSGYLRAVLIRDGARVIRRPAAVPDDAQALIRALDESRRASFVILTGGASVGAFDVVRDVLEGAGGTFRSVMMQPGKPQGWALWGGAQGAGHLPPGVGRSAPGTEQCVPGRSVPVIALPGNPVSAALSYEVFVRPMIDRILGRPAPSPATGVMQVGWRSPVGRLQLQPVTLSCGDDGRLLARPSHRGGSASHLVSALVGAHGIALVPAETTVVNAGDMLPVHLLRSRLGGCQRA
jgi:molybdopterin molybdotransferase